MTSAAFIRFVEPWFGLLGQLRQSNTTATIGSAVAQAGVVFPAGYRDRFFVRYPCFADLLEDYLPSADILLALAQRNLGESVSPSNVEVMRAEVERLARRKGYRQRQLILESIGARFPPRTPLGEPELVTAVITEYEPQVAAINNRGVALAGRVHELVLMDALEAAGLRRGSDFEKPSNPTKNGDIRVRAPNNDYVGTEVKSLKARERFARGLGEIGTSKVGAGFFDDPTEFTGNLTTALIGMSTRAVYLPQVTLERMPSDIRHRVNAADRQFYRPITRYADDMVRFARTGQLP